MAFKKGHKPTTAQPAGDETTEQKLNKFIREHRMANSKQRRVISTLQMRISSLEEEQTSLTIALEQTEERICQMIGNLIPEAQPATHKPKKLAEQLAASRNGHPILDDEPVAEAS